MMRGRAVAVAVMAAIVAASMAFALAHRWAAAALHAELDQTLVLTTRAVEAEIDRFRALPDVAGEDVSIRTALIDESTLQDANEYLETIAAHAGAAELFLIDAGGRTIAASNWNRPGSFIGQHYGFRPYFTQAMQTGRGQFYAIGVTTGVPGYFLSTRVQTGDVQGVLVVKLDLRPLQETWRNAAAKVALADADGVVFLAGREDWMYRPLSALPTEVLARLGQTRAYDGVALDRATPLFHGAAQGTDASGQGWIARLASVQGAGWTLIATQPATRVQSVALGWAMGVALLVLALAGGLKSWDQRRQILALRLSQSEKLEAMVKARTADLAREVSARTQAEADLRAAQEDLIHAEKMAALGRMSTAIVHEISQPLAAMEATLTAAEMTLAPTDTQTAPRLATAKGLIRRMQRTTKHLKSFGRKETGERSQIDLRSVAQSALDLVSPRAKAAGVLPLFDRPDTPIEVFAGAIRMEQVTANLLLNALDAVEGRAGATVRLSLETRNGQALLTVTDTGHGIAAPLLSRVTEPFFSTRTSTEGLGLGLAICKAIMAEFGGDLTLISQEGLGTTVVAALPVSDPAQMAAE